jgi:DNA-binding NarL/FixJ family response regulator
MLSAAELVHILIVDDDPICRRVIRQHLNAKLSGFGRRFWEAEDAAAGLKIIESSPIDLAICDLNMPGNFGGDALSVLAKKNKPTIKTVLFTGTHEDLAQYFKAYHFDACIGKSGEESIQKLAQTCIELLPLRWFDHEPATV